MEQKICLRKINGDNKIDVEIEAFADGLCEDIISRYNGLKTGKAYEAEASDKLLELPKGLDGYNMDTIRYSVIDNLEEDKETMLSLDKIIKDNNNILLGILNNYINRCLVYVKRHFGGKLPGASADNAIKESIDNLYLIVEEKIQQKQFKLALKDIFAFIRKANDYFDRNQPWIQVEENRTQNEKVLYNCIIIIGNLSNLLAPFLPECCNKIRSFLNIKELKWSYIEETELVEVSKLSALFEWIDIDAIKDDI